MSRIIFVTSTGTGIGKTHVTCEAIRNRINSGFLVNALKPIISGFDPAEVENSDTGLLLQALGRDSSEENIAAISPWRFSAPLSPDQAAVQEDQPLDLDALVEFCKTSCRDDYDYHFIEGVGGLMVPLNDRHTVLDWIKALDCDIWLVAGTYLGSLSHTLTACDVLHHHDIKLSQLILSESAENSVGLQQTATTLGNFLQKIPITGIRRQEEN
ncbi:dethiobiotin synthase [Emcibacter nanhaiensis]|uniref:ATP-dependent dethiobiotin synthetase BioD n=1 Tax=Emcibacter nanhaiensis TaxID=1505037 RepID=A0A501PGN9_9PROT|nr:dethiobiotin synthase [Emcibacter nanhaiensis]TPD59237.1 dethiobiotin synthase [Emcibacter nanhaiensis]